MSENDARRAFQQLLMDLAVRLDFLIRSAQIYPENHPSLDTALESVCALVRSAVDGRDSVTFYPAGRRFVVDEVSVRLVRAIVDRSNASRSAQAQQAQAAQQPAQGQYAGKPQQQWPSQGFPIEGAK